MMLVPTTTPPRSDAWAVPDEGLELVADATIFRPPAAGRVHVDTDRGPVLLRPVNPTDVPGLDTFVRTLSATSRFRRFHTGLHHLTPRQLAGLVDVDHHRRETLVTLSGREVVGMGQYLAQEDPAGSVELAVVVADGWQRLGLGRALLTSLATAAASAGFTTATALVQADNQPVMHLLHQLDGRAQLTRAGSTLDAVIRL